MKDPADGGTIDWVHQANNRGPKGGKKGAERQRELVARKRAAGLVELKAWVPADLVARLKEAGKGHDFGATVTAALERALADGTPLDVPAGYAELPTPGALLGELLADETAAITAPAVDASEAAIDAATEELWVFLSSDQGLTQDPTPRVSADQVAFVAKEIARLEAADGGVRGTPHHPHGAAGDRGWPDDGGMQTCRLPSR